MNIPTIISSRDIAELTSTDHKRVIHDIEWLLPTVVGDGDVLKFEHTYHDNGKESREYRLPKREGLIVMAGYSVRLRARIIDRYLELLEACPHQGAAQSS